MNIQYRQARLEELPIAYHLLKVAARRLSSMNVDQWQYWLEPPAYKINWLEAGFSNNEYYFILDEKDIIGMYRLSNEDLDYWGEQSVNARYIHSLIVLPSYSGQGIGSQAVAHIESLCTREGIFLLRLDCHAGNHALCAYYERLGFKKVGEVDMPHSLNNLYEKKLASNA